MPALPLDHIIISRTDSIGDVMLTLPMIGALRKQYPNARIGFVGRTYTEAIAWSCAHIDYFINRDTIIDNASEALRTLNADAIIHVFPDAEIMKAAKVAQIPVRIATASRLASWKYCNRRVWFTRKRSALHESQLNFHLLHPLGAFPIPPLLEMPKLYGFRAHGTLPSRVSELLDTTKIRVILHPLSKGSAINWSLSNFNELAHLLVSGRFQVFITGTEAEGTLIKAGFKFDSPHLVDLTGKLTLNELIIFISQCDALVAASTGPLHIAAALGKKAIGLYAPQRPIHPGRWAPVGEYASVCVSKLSSENSQALSITPETVAQLLLVFSEEKE